MLGGVVARSVTNEMRVVEAKEMQRAPISIELGQVAVDERFTWCLCRQEGWQLPLRNLLFEEEEGPGTGRYCSEIEKRAPKV